MNKHKIKIYSIRSFNFKFQPNSFKKNWSYHNHFKSSFKYY